MEKPMTFFVTYKNQKKYVECYQSQFLQKVSEAFQIDKKDISIFARHKSDRYNITTHDLKDLMKIEIISKKEHGSKNLPLHFTVEPKEMISLKESIVTKLQTNSTLNGNERKLMIQFLNGEKELPNLKRKQNGLQTNITHVNKKVQVSFSSLLFKDSFTQTDPLDYQLPEENNEAHKQEMKKLLYTGCEDKELVKQLMDKTFFHRRNFIMHTFPSVVLVRDEFPFLFSYEEIKNEMRRIFCQDICDLFISRMKKTSQVIVKEMASKNDVYLRTIKSIEKAPTDLSKMYAAAVGSIFILAKNLKEDCCFIHLNDTDFPESLSVYPHISAPLSSMKEIFFDGMTFNIIVEEKKVCEAPNLLEAVMCLMGVFFIFNIDYPKQCVRTFTVFEKVFLGANDTFDIDEETYQCLKLLELRTTM